MLVVGAKSGAELVRLWIEAIVLSPACDGLIAAVKDKLSAAIAAAATVNCLPRHAGAVRKFTCSNHSTSRKQGQPTTT